MPNAVLAIVEQCAVGSAKSRVVTACRAAIKANNIRSLFHIINQGRAPLASG
jgi:hypothetical protein